MNITFINLDVLALICVVVLVLTAIADGYKNELVKLISFTVITLVVVIFKNSILTLLNDKKEYSAYDYIKYITFILLFVMGYKIIKMIIIKIIIRKIITKNKQKQLVSKENKFVNFLISILVGLINSFIIINLIICSLSLVINIDQNSYMVKIYNIVNEFIFNNSYLRWDYGR